jgi:soluble lytic murein transglycosylase-like protein
VPSSTSSWSSHGDLASHLPAPRPAGRRSRTVVLTASALLGAGLCAGLDAGPGAAPAAAAASHTVTPGDTFFDLAAANGTTVAALRAANPGLDPRRIRPGQVVTVPSPTSTRAASASAAPASPAAPRRAATHTVAAGDTLFDLAAANGTTVAALRAANPGVDPRHLAPGAVLALLSAGAAAPAAAPAVKAPGASAAAPMATTFAGRSYPTSVTASATAHRDALASRDLPSRAAMRATVARTADALGVDRSLALAVAHQESGFNMGVVSPADAVGVMQVVPASARWASQLVGRPLDPLDPEDNATAGVAILAQLTRTAPDEDTAVAGYYQGLAGVLAHGMAADTKGYVASVQAQRQGFR